MGSSHLLRRSTSITMPWKPARLSTIRFSPFICLLCADRMSSDLRLRISLAAANSMPILIHSLAHALIMCVLALPLRTRPLRVFRHTPSVCLDTPPQFVYTRPLSMFSHTPSVCLHTPPQCV